MKIKIDKHLAHPWRVHALLPDFRIEDAWQLPVVLEPHHSLQLFVGEFLNTHDPLARNPWVRALFRLRNFLGQMFKWDEKIKVDRLIPGTIRERYARAENLSFEDLPRPGSQQFIPVYLLENEYLTEVENKTVHAAVHFGRVQTQQGLYTIQMVIYVKPKGLLGNLYMMLIKPFRHWMVYPAIMKGAKVKWEKYVSQV